ncbi:YjeF-related domain protein [Metarhizium robertsii]|uniref:Enhancer of mRNA-decapping protein 3 n=2 Tax=Metarhizium robertsii TaxID=568076 RepID=E9ETX7_METRA|nr:YjeF-related protein [Metarhizium robertsii ARSEF 23]EFZ00880.1 YjeF-related protein [Metarhizium robertsii ARSEF 23]EXV03406.1 YjeF-related domain protein [Metarhizium robertsii]
MASQFIGLHMEVVLREPSGYRLTGIVRDVEAGSSLTLTDVRAASTGKEAVQMTIDAANIAGLSEVTSKQASPTKYVSPALEIGHPPVPQPAPPNQQLPQSFVDPAILSVGRRPTSNTPSASAPGPQYQSDKGEVPVERPGVLSLATSNNLQGRRPEQDILDSIQGLKISHNSNSGRQTSTAVAASQTPSQKKKGRSKNSKQAKANNATYQDKQDADGSNVSGHGKGWRQTPILHSTPHFQPFNSLKKNDKGRKGLADNGWASEDVTEEMGDFDFENNLAKFDKRTIFDQMRKEDEIDDADRLVSHNRRPKPGTAGGKNLHYTEMVLDVPSSKGGQNADFWNSEAELGLNESERPSGREAKNGGASSATAAAAAAPVKPRAESKSGLSRRSQSRKASGAVTSQPLSRVNSAVRLSQSSTRWPTPKSGNRDADGRLQQRVEQAGLYLIPSQRRLEAISTLQMLNLENIAANEIGFSEALMAENAGRGIAEVAVTALSDPATKVRFGLALAAPTTDISSSLGASTIVVLAGNNKSGIRALAAARHLRNKNFDVLVCLVGFEREKDLLEDLRRQIQLYRAFGGKVHNKNDFFEHLRRSSASATPVSVSLIIDALLGLTMSFEELRIGDQATVYELMEWANRNEAFVLSVDVPTGIDPTSGKIAVIDGAHLYVKPRYVVAIGAPKKGLLEAVTPPLDGEPGPLSSGAHEDEWRLFIADMGLGSAVWRKAGTKVRKGIDFDGKWVLEMRYQGVEVDYEED